MVDQTFKATAVVVDQGSGPLNNIAKAIKYVSAEARLGARSMTHEFKQLGETMKPVIGHLDVINPAMKAFGVSALSVTGVIGGLAFGLQRLASNRAELKEAAENIGLTTDRLKAAQAAGELFHIPAENMTRDLKTFTRAMQEVGNHTPEGRALLDWMAKQKGWGPAFAHEFEEAARAGDYERGLKLAGDQLDRFKDPTTKDIFGEKMFGDAAIGRLKHFNEEMDNISKSMLHLTPEQQENLEKLDRSWIQLQQRAANYRDYLLAQLAPAGMEVFGLLDEKMQSIVTYTGQHPEQLKKFFVGDMDMASFSQSLDELGGQVEWFIKKANEAADWLNNIQQYTKQAAEETNKFFMHSRPEDGGTTGAPTFGPVPAIPGASPGQGGSIDWWGTHGQGLDKSPPQPPAAVKENEKTIWHNFWDLFHKTGLDVIEERAAAGPGGGGEGGGPGMIGGGRFPSGGNVRGFRPGRGGGGSYGDSQESGPGTANVRYNNPGAQYPWEGAKKFGMTGKGVIGGGHLIADFPSPEQGAAANMDLLAHGARFGAGRTIGQTETTWTGGSRGDVAGYSSSTVITKEMLNDPNFMIPYMKSVAANEGGGKFPMTDQQWQNAFQIYQRGGDTSGITLTTRPGGARPGPGAFGGNQGFSRYVGPGGYSGIRSPADFPTAGDPGKTNLSVDTELARRTQAALAAMPPEIRKTFRVAEEGGYRSDREQAEIYERSGHGRLYAAAAPGHSHHRLGQALDIESGPARDWLYAHGAQYGVGFPYASDAPHMELLQGFKDTTDVKGRVDVHVRGPRGTKVNTKADGVFKEVTTNRAKQMPDSKMGTAAEPIGI
jgi:hypothetical protein